MTPQPPTAAETRHLLVMRHIWRVAQGIIRVALDPLLAVWPYRGDATQPPRQLPPGSPPARPDAYTPLSPPPRLPHMSRMTDEALRRMWPNANIDLLRRFAPWAVSYSEVRRLTASAGTPFELQRSVLAAIELERHATRVTVSPATWTVVRSPEAFASRYPPEVRAIFDAVGVPIPLPPIPREVTQETIRRQFDWATLALETQVTDTRIRPAVAGVQDMLDDHSYQQTRRALGIDLNRDVPELRAQRDTWFREHVDLIESGIRAPLEGVQLRPSLLEDIRQTLTESYNRGLRVEVVAGGLEERYGVSEARAELIARDQTLKANGRLTRARQESAGVTQYKWLTSRDARVRDTHKALHGTLQSWANPPPVGGGRHEHPGGDYQCRCQAIPVAPAWLSEGVEEMRMADFPTAPRTGER